MAGAKSTKMERHLDKDRYWLVCEEICEHYEHYEMSGFKMLRVTEINEINRLVELRDEWNYVLERSRDNHVYLTWEYLSTYVKHYGKEKKLKILYVKDKNKIIAIAPLRQSRYNFANRFSYNVIEPLAYMHTDYTGFIFAEREVECFRLFLNHLFEQDDWDFIYLYDIPGTSIIPKLLSKMSKNRPAFELIEGVICPYISIPSSIDILMKELSAKFRKNLRRCMKKLQNDYQKVELKRYDEFGSFKESMQAFFDLHQKRWTLKGKPGVYNSQKSRDFYLDVSELFAGKGWLALYFLTANDKPIAVQYCLKYKQKMLYVLGGFDPDFSQYSLGNLILAKVVEKCIEKKIKEYDLMKGDEPYKFNWAAKYRRNLGFRFVNRKFTSDLYHWGIRTLKQTKMEKIFGRFLDF